MIRKNILIISLFITSSLYSYSQNVDINALKKIHTNSEMPSDKSWDFLSNTTYPVAVATPVAMFITGLATHNKELQLKSAKSGASIVLASGLSLAIKISVKRPRPYTTYPVLIIKKGKGGNLSFPSGHTTTAFATATSLSLAFPKWYVIVPSYTFASAVAYSRMHLGMHYPSDVLAGIVIGIGTSFLTFQADKWLNKKVN
jgi:membrane-associated phospholipid phosphatase